MTLFCRYTGEVIYGSSAVEMYQGDSEEYNNLYTELKWKERIPGMVAGVGVLAERRPGTLLSRIWARSYPNDNLLLWCNAL